MTHHDLTERLRTRVPAPRFADYPPGAAALLTVGWAVYEFATNFYPSPDQSAPDFESPAYELGRAAGEAICDLPRNHPGYPEWARRVEAVRESCLALMVGPGLDADALNAASRALTSLENATAGLPPGQPPGG